MWKVLRKTSEGSSLHPHLPSRTSTPSSSSSSSSSSRSNLDSFVVPSNRQGIHNTTRFTSDLDSEELVTKYTTGNIPEDVFMSMVPLEPPPSDLSTQSILQAAAWAYGGKRHSLNPSFGMLPMARFLAGCDDPPVLSMLGMPPMLLPNTKLPTRDKPPLHISSTLGIPFRQSAECEPSRNGSPKPRWIKARQGKPAAQEPLEAKHCILGEQASSPETQDSPHSKIVQSANGKGKNPSNPPNNPDSRGKASTNAKEGGGQTGGGKANNRIASQGGGGTAGNGGNDPPKKSNREVKESAAPLGYLCFFLRRSKWELDARCMVNCAANASQICKHLATTHGYTNDNLYLVEPEMNNEEHQNTRRGLCKVCYEVFEYFKKPEGYVQDADLMGRSEDKFLLEHVKYHERVAKEEGKENASPDNQESTPLKYVAMLLLFGVRQSLNEIRANHRIPFTKVEKDPVVKLEVQTPINAEGPASSSAGQDQAVHTPPGSISRSSLKRSVSPLVESHTPIRPQKRHKDTLPTHQDDSFGTRTQNTSLIQSPLKNSNEAVLLTDRPAAFSIDAEEFLEENDTFLGFFTSGYDTRTSHGQDSDMNGMQNLTYTYDDSLLELEEEGGI